MKRIWMPLPDRDFDTTETAVPWKVLTRAGCEVIFATEAGADGPVWATGRSTLVHRIPDHGTFGAWLCDGGSGQF